MSQYIAKWKDGFTVSWRDLTWEEYRQFKSRYDNSMFEESLDISLALYGVVYIEGPDPSFIPAGIPCYICKQQLLNNPFSGRYEDIISSLETARKLVSGNYLLSAKGIIANTLNYKPEEIDNWNSNTFFIRLAQAEIASGKTYEPVNPAASKHLNQPVDQFKLRKNLSTAQLKALDRTKKRDGA